MSDKPTVIRTDLFSKGFYVAAGKPYQIMNTFSQIPLVNIKNAGKMVKGGDAPIVYFIELENEIYHGARREFGCESPDGNLDFEKQFPEFPYSAERYRNKLMENKIDSLERKIDDLRSIIMLLADASGVHLIPTNDC
jgi:hypothetical protein